ncbi:MAG: lysophospholipid acyltransferase family protein [Deltaproteobacteria bacterium]|nr:MAG: lysophospholipid acyltransferase family protein [Deltaproteobacteria bacterium]
MPHRSGLAMAAGLGRAFARVPGTRRRVALENLRVVFPTWSERRRRQLLRASYAHLGQTVYECFDLDRITREDVRRRVSFEGLEHLDEARKHSKPGGVILLTAHFGSFELMAVACGLSGFPVTLVHRTFTNAHTDRMVTAWRERAGVEVLRRKSAARAALRALRKGRLLALPLDQNARRREGIFVPFFGRTASTRDAPARLAMRFECPVVPVFMYRLEDGEHHVVRIGREIEIEPPGDEAEAAVRRNVCRMNRTIESAILEAPEQWLWIHRRWKTQPRPATELAQTAQPPLPGASARANGGARSEAS